MDTEVILAEENREEFITRLRVVINECFEEEKSDLIFRLSRKYPQLLEPTIKKIVNKIMEMAIVTVVEIPKKEVKKW